MKRLILLCVALYTTGVAGETPRILKAAEVAMKDYQAQLATESTDWEYGEYSTDIRNYNIGMTETKQAYVVVIEIKDIPGLGPFIGGRSDYFIDKQNLKILRYEEHR